MGLEVRQYDVMVSATSEDLPSGVAAALTASTIEGVPAGEAATVSAAGIRWATRSWGDTADPPLLLIHGIMSDAGVFWRLAPALAAAGWSVVAVDLPAHGGTGPWHGRYALADTAADVAACIRAMSMDTGELVVLGHYWGAMVVASLPASGFRPRAAILLDPPYLERDELVALTRDRTERYYPSVEEARANLRAANPKWSDGDIEAKARALTRFERDGVRAILSNNGGWDAGLTLLAQPATAGLPVWYLRGEPRLGGLIPDELLPALACRVGSDRVLTIAGGSHGPMRTRHPESVTLAILRALEGTHQST